MKPKPNKNNQYTFQLKSFNIIKYFSNSKFLNDGRN